MEELQENLDVESDDPLDVSRRLTKIPDRRPHNGEFSDTWEGQLQQGKEMLLVAIKVLRGAPSHNLELQESTVQKLNEYGKHWVRLNHRNVLPFYGIAYGYGFLPAMVTLWCSKGNILEYIRDTRGDEKEKLRLIIEAAQGLEFLHSEKVVHGDLRAANIMINNDGTAMLADYELTFVIDHAEFTTNKIAGPARWMAPELMDPPSDDYEPHYDRSTDVFAFGMTVLEICTQNQPFSTVRSDSAIILKIMRGERPTAQLDEIADAGIRNMISKTWETEPTARPTMPEIVETLIKIRREHESFFDEFFSRFWEVLNWFTSPLLSRIWRRR